MKFNKLLRLVKLNSRNINFKDWVCTRVQRQFHHIIRTSCSRAVIFLALLHCYHFTFINAERKYAVLLYKHWNSFIIKRNRKVCALS